jgi:hypothetical protein
VPGQQRPKIETLLPLYVSARAPGRHAPFNRGRPQWAGTTFSGEGGRPGGGPDAGPPGGEGGGEDAPEEGSGEPEEGSGELDDLELAPLLVLETDPLLGAYFLFPFFCHA